METHCKNCNAEIPEEEGSTIFVLCEDCIYSILKIDEYYCTRCNATCCKVCKKPSYKLNKNCRCSRCSCQDCSCISCNLELFYSAGYALGTQIIDYPECCYDYDDYYTMMLGKHEYPSSLHKKNFKKGLIGGVIAIMGGKLSLPIRTPTPSFMCASVSEPVTVPIPDIVLLPDIVLATEGETAPKKLTKLQKLKKRFQSLRHTHATHATHAPL